MAIRLAIGAGRARLIRQLMTENFLLGLAGLALGLAIGALITSILPALIIQPPGFFVPIDFNFDSRVLSFSFAVSLVTILFLALPPHGKARVPPFCPLSKAKLPSRPLPADGRSATGSQLRRSAFRSLWLRAPVFSRAAFSAPARPISALDGSRYCSFGSPPMTNPRCTAT